MPLPNPNVLKAFLEQYKLMRKQNWDSVLNSTVTAILKKAKGLDIPGERTSECDHFQHKFAEAQTTREWLGIIHELSRKATEAENQTYINTSLLSETLHALRCYIIAMLKYTPKDGSEADLSIKNEFEQAVQQLRFEVNSKAMEVKKARHSGLDPSRVEELIVDKNKLVLQLADLNDEDAIFEAIDAGLFPKGKFKYPTRNDRYRMTTHQEVNKSINPNMPLLYQRAYYYIFYAQNFFPVTQQSFKEFLQDALNRAAEPNPVDIEDLLFSTNDEAGRELSVETQEVDNFAAVAEIKANDVTSAINDVKVEEAGRNRNIPSVEADTEKEEKPQNEDSEAAAAPSVPSTPLAVGTVFNTRSKKQRAKEEAKLREEAKHREAVPSVGPR